MSTGWRECPGAAQCPSGSECFAEAARQRAAEADVVVVNTHLYATSLAMSEAELLPAHDLVVFDEAHELEDIASAAFGFDLSQARLVALARMARPLVADSAVVAGLEDGRCCSAVRSGLIGTRPWHGRWRRTWRRVLGLLRARQPFAGGTAQGWRTGVGGSGAGGGSGGGAGGGSGAGGDKVAPGARALRAQKAAALLVDELNGILSCPKDRWRGSKALSMRRCCGWRRSTWARLLRSGFGTTRTPRRPS